MSDETFADRQLALVHSLYDRTKAGKIEWQETEYSDAFEARVGGYVFSISLVPDQDYPDEPDYLLRVRDSNEKKVRWIDTVSNASLRPVMDKLTPDGVNPYGVLSRLYELARRQALHVEDALERILATLNGV